jgi:hypothetical protein
MGHIDRRLGFLDYVSLPKPFERLWALSSFSEVTVIPITTALMPSAVT